MVFAAALVAFLIWRRRRLEPTLLAGGVVVAVAAFVYSLGVIHFPNLEDPEGLAAVLRDFLETTQPARIGDADWSGLVGRHSPRAWRMRRAAA